VCAPCAWLAPGTGCCARQAFLGRLISLYQGDTNVESLSGVTTEHVDAALERWKLTNAVRGRTVTLGASTEEVPLLEVMEALQGALRGLDLPVVDAEGATARASKQLITTTNAAVIKRVVKSHQHSRQHSRAGSAPGSPQGGGGGAGAGAMGAGAGGAAADAALFHAPPSAPPPPAPVPTQPNGGGAGGAAPTPVASAHGCAPSCGLEMRSAAFPPPVQADSSAAADGAAAAAISRV